MGTKNEHRRATYHRRTSERTLQNIFPMSRKYHSMDDIMERTFTIDSSFSKCVPHQHNFPVGCSSDNVHNIGETYYNQEDHCANNVDTNFHHNPFGSANASFEQG